jgi:hypothetical protein
LVIGFQKFFHPAAAEELPVIENEQTGQPNLSQKPAAQQKQFAVAWPP